MKFPERVSAAFCAELPPLVRPERVTLPPDAERVVVAPLVSVDLVPVLLPEEVEVLLWRVVVPLPLVVLLPEVVELP